MFALAGSACQDECLAGSDEIGRIVLLVLSDAPADSDPLRSPSTTSTAHR